MVVNGSLSKTAVNGSAGAKTLSGIVVAALTILTLLFLTGLFEDLPEATLGAVVIAALIELVDIPALVRLYRLHTRGAARVYQVAARPDFVAAFASLIGVLVFDTLPAQAAKEAVPGIAILRVEGGLFFRNADAVRERIVGAAAEGTRPVVLDAGVPYIDVTASGMLVEPTQTLRERGVQLVVARELGGVRDIVRGAAGPDSPAPVYPSVAQAVAALEAGYSSGAGDTV